MPSFTTEESKELNRALALRLFNVDVDADCCEEGGGNHAVYHHHGYPPHGGDAYSTSYEGMGAVLEAMLERGWFFCVEDMERGCGWVWFWKDPQRHDGGASTADGGLPIAVALAAKAALESETGSPS